MKPKKKEKLIGEILVERGIITPHQLKKVLENQQKEGGLIGEIIVKLGFATEEEIAQCLSYQYGFPYLPLENYEISKEAIELVPRHVAQHYCLIPVDKIGNTLTIAISDPLNSEAIEDLEELTSLNIQVFISTSSDIRQAIEKYYPDG
ncbi:MAG: hypothetical protein DRP76_01940 [Candidatus Omnitrophota bacterium]|nr:MAG: hypothetical protein DRP76_01940 [Candidatus Omnitrophota bacterium]